MLMLAAVAVAGMVLAFPVSFGIALVVSSGLSYLGNPGGHAALLSAPRGTLLMAAALVESVAHRRWRFCGTKRWPRREKPRARAVPQPPRDWRSRWWAGVLIGTAYPLLAKTQDVNTGWALTPPDWFWCSACSSAL